MSYEPIEQPDSADPELKEIDLEGSETDIEANPPGSEDSYFLGWKRRSFAENKVQTLYKKALRANIPVIVSLHLLAFNLILSIALSSLLWKSYGTTTCKKSSTEFAPGELLYTVGQDVIEHRIESGYVGPGYSTGFKASPYQGWPNDENDRLWKRYEDGNHIRITPEEAAQLAQPTVHVPMEEHKGDYLVGLVVFHHLHCISAIRRALYPRRYRSQLYGDDGRVDYEAWHHIDHCIEIIRSYLECHPETTAMNFEWVPDSTIAVRPRTPHTCRNFESFADWAYERSVDVPVRANVEADGRVVDYTGRPYGREYNETWVLRAPEGWAYTKDDM